MSPEARGRGFAFALFIPSVAVLGVARWLAPNPAGVGTHIQLGLAPCGVMTWVGIPCPMCGMTTTFSLLANLRPLDAVVNQPFGVVLFAITVIVAGIGALEIVRPANRWDHLIRWSNGREVHVLTAFVVLMLASWLYKVAAMSDFFTSPT